MKRVVFFFALALATAAMADEVTERWYAGASASAMIPQGGSRMRNLGGAAFRAGGYLNNDLAIEGEAAWLENVAGLGLGALWHLQGWSVYGDLFGYSQFDPFLTGGARGWIGDGMGQVGPRAGIGAFYHLTDSVAIRADADVTLGLDCDTEALYSLALGVQYSF